MPKVRVALSLPEEEVKAYRREAEMLGLTLSQYVGLTMSSNAFLLPEETSEKSNAALQKLREKTWGYA